MLWLFGRKKEKDPGKRPVKVSYMPWPLQAGVLVFMGYLFFTHQNLRQDYLTDTPGSAPPEIPQEPGDSARESSPIYSTVQTVTLQQGSGPAARCGDRVTVTLKLVTKDGRALTEATQEKPLSFHLGDKEQIAGLSQSIVGMRAGERRDAVIPPELAGKPNEGGYLGAEIALLALDPYSLETPDDALAAHVHALEEKASPPVRCGETVRLSSISYAPENAETVLRKDEQVIITVGGADTPPLITHLLSQLSYRQTALVVIPDNLTRTLPADNALGIPPGRFYIARLNVHSPTPGAVPE